MFEQGRAENALHAVDERFLQGGGFQRGALVVGVWLSGKRGGGIKIPCGAFVAHPFAHLDDIGGGSSDELGDEPIHINFVRNRELLHPDVWVEFHILGGRQIEGPANTALQLPMGKANDNLRRVGIQAGRQTVPQGSGSCQKKENGDKSQTDVIPNSGRIIGFHCLSDFEVGD